MRNQPEPFDERTTARALLERNFDGVEEEHIECFLRDTAQGFTPNQALNRLVIQAGRRIPC